jgi:hypothetical protein
MALTDLSKKAERIEAMIADAFLDDGGTYRSFGILQDVTITFDPVNQDADVAGREKQIAVDISFEIVMEQTADEEFGAVADLVQTSGKGDTVKLTKSKTDAGSAGSADGFEIQNIFLSVSGEFDGSGEGSMFTVTGEGRVVAEEIRDPSTIQVDV